MDQTWKKKNQGIESKIFEETWGTITYITQKIEATKTNFEQTWCIKLEENKLDELKRNH